MNQTNRLGLFVVIISLVIVIATYAGYRVLLSYFQPEPFEQINSSTATETALQDTDQDGLPDEFEETYLTAFDNNDTDGDGTTDLAEIEAGRDPIKPGPGDEITLPTGDAVIDPTTYTGRYLATLPTNASRAQILQQDKIAAFLDFAGPPLLPDVLSSITTTKDSGVAAITAYLDAISASHNDALAMVTNEDIAAALASQLQGNTQAMAQVQTLLEQNTSTLKAVAAPSEVQELHTKLVAASQSLLDNVVLLHNLDNDFIGGLLGSQNIDLLGPVFRDISAQVTALEEKYKIQ
jgi:hypothetical protein